MKKIFINLAMTLIIPALYFAFISAFTKAGSTGNDNTVSNTASTDTTKFINMIMNMDSRNCDGIWVGEDVNLNMYKELGYNSVQVFPADDSVYGVFPTPLNGTQIGNNQNLIASVKNKDLKFFYEHVFLSYLCYAQRLIYLVHKPNETTQTNNGFCFQNTAGTLITENDTTVLEVEKQTNPAYTLVCDDIYENLQHSDYFGRQFDKGDWNVRPMIKLDVNNITDKTPIFRIVYYNFNGDSIEGKSKTILAENFKLNGYYNGGYKDIFYEISNDPIILSISGSETIDGLNYGRDNPNTYLKLCKVDFKIFTYGQAKFWFKKLTVDDFYANKLFDPILTNNYEDILQNSLQYIGGDPNLFSYYMDEVTYSQLPCVKYVMDKISAYPNIKFMVSEANWMNANTTRSKNLGHGTMLSLLKPRVLNTFIYEFYNYSYGNVWYPPLLPSDAIGAGNIDPRINGDWLTNKNSYNAYLQEKVFGDKFTSINNLHRQGSYIYQVALAKTGIINNSSSTLLYITPQIQGEMYINSAGYLDNIREPLNEEIEAQTMLALSHGADGLINYIFQSKHWKTKNTANFHLFNFLNQNSNDSTDFYSYCLYGRFSNTEQYSKRDSNLYNQNKWEFMKKLNAKINKWIPTLDKITWQDGFSVHSEGATHYCINNIQSLYASTNGGTPICQEDNIWADCNDEKYWEEGFFAPKDNNDKSKYFLMTNRRCAPDVAPMYLGDIRQLKINFMASQLSGFNNWKIINVENDSVINTFDKNAQTYINLGTFQPGEGKLFKLAPVMQEGGTLTGDETVSGSFYCNGKVVSNNNIAISPGVTIKFSDNASIEMNGGNFTCGTYNTENPVTLIGKNESNVWNGLVLSNCSSIGIYNTNISKIHANDTAKAVLISNCNNVNIGNTVFNVGTNSGAIQAVYTEISEEAPVTFNVSNSSFVMGSSSYSAISIISNASSTLPVVIDWCNFTTNNENANAITLSGVTGGAIKNSTFTNFASTINTLSSAIDLYGNTIIGRSNSNGVLCVDGSSISLSPTSGLYLGGYNYIRNYGGSSSNICSDNSLFNIHTGGNNFDLNETASAKHLSGNFSGIPYQYVNAIKNCFHKDSITNIEAVHSVVWYDNSPVNFIFTDYSCDFTPPENYQLFVYNGYSDTVYYRSGGEGGGFNPNKPINSMNIEENVYKSLKDSININLRKRNYLIVEDKAKQLLTQYPDSLESAAMVQKLYMASLSLDSTKIGITKTFLENLIAANTQNPTLIKRAFYFIQKCKVKLGQFQSALDGFQYIMTQNPYTYEGLVASWDYAATYLLMGSGGSYKGDNEEQTEELNTPADTLLSRMTKRDINTNKTKNNSSSEQITKTFYEKVKNVTKDDKTTQEAKVKTLEKKIESSKNKTEKNDAANELAKMKQIKETVKINKPNTVNTHIAILNSDIKKVFGIGKKSTNETEINLVPTSYNLYQNYPNPFNPTTKIAYDIPRDAKVKLVIYDILGREVKTLVNNEFRSAGKYITEFNGSNLASGIYFARILVNEGKDFMAVKKMVLIK